MGKIKKLFENYFEKSSWVKIGFDVLFFLLLALLLIPSTRTLLIRATLLKPKISKVEVASIIKQEDFQMILEDLQGNRINLQEFSNQVIFINFWATWCPPCRAEMPSIQKLCKQYEKRLPIFLITNEERSKVENYLKEYGYDLPVYFQKTESKGILDVQSLPTSFLISDKREILVHKKGAANWNSREFRKVLENILK